MVIHGNGKNNYMEDKKTNDAYKNLEVIFKKSRIVCDPVQFAYLQQLLLESIAEYIVLRDKKFDEREDEESSLRLK